tara:strand:- start:108 stop:875 length:768 start_codon:yes stop_codon:yes gene_type:complete
VNAWVLAVGGEDPSGAGLDADRDAAFAADVRLVTVATCHTDQSDAGVRDVGPVDADAWRFDALAAASIENPGALKFGLLPGRAHLEAARAVVDQFAFEAPGMPVVVDPVIASSSGFVFVEELEPMRALIARGVIVTPNLPELAALARVELASIETDLEARLAAALGLCAWGSAAVVVKGGHGAEDPIVDLVVLDGEAVWLERPRLAGASIRGSGCRFATYVAARLARGSGGVQGLVGAVREAGEWVASRLVDARS